MSWEPQVRVLNLGARQARRRLVFGILWAAVALTGSGLLWYFEVDAWWWLALFVPYWLGLLGILQYRMRT